MVFSSPVFLFFFLPAVWIFHIAIPKQQKSLYLLIASLIFYLYGEGFFIALMLYTICITYFSVYLILSSAKYRKLFAFLGISLNMTSLLIFKYTDFILGIFNDYLGAEVTRTGIHLPLGISFFTFQAVSCIVDVYRKKDHEMPSFSDIALYISFFPQLIAGPIVRYNTFIPQLPDRKITLAAFLWGARRFIYGLAKKVLIANTLSISVDRIFLLGQKDLSTATAWFGVFLFSLQLYFDFSGYSDMAIGLARMFGIKIPENFNYPYISKSIMEFWRRWHISLSTWFRDYLYIPLGGNRGSALKTYFNLWIVFFLCGLWHGASWNYVAFGISHGFLIMFEKLHASISKRRLPPFIAGIKTIFLLYLSFAIFRTSSLEHFAYFFHSMFVPHGKFSEIIIYVDWTIAVSIVAGTVFTFPLYPAIVKKYKSRASKNIKNFFSFSEVIILALLFALSIAHSSMVSADPFIYFRF